ncbi:DUF4411 family protein [Candidatus Micrarchaeota archaeon]|nr:DUF4411 family protein [Candidatus Micrarchaeota archaeon]
MADEAATYIADTSALIEIQRKYPIDVFKSLWTNLSELAQNDKIIAPKLVFEEINRYAREDYLKTWATQHKKIFKDTTPAHILKVKEILKQFPKLIDAASEYEQADPYVIALACCTEPQSKLFENVRVVVTEESFTKENKIPFVCNKLGIQCLNTLAFFRQEGWKF